MADKRYHLFVGIAFEFSCYFINIDPKAEWCKTDVKVVFLKNTCSLLGQTFKNNLVYSILENKKMEFLIG